MMKKLYAIVLGLLVATLANPVPAATVTRGANITAVDYGPAKVDSDYQLKYKQGKDTTTVYPAGTSSTARGGDTVSLVSTDIGTVSPLAGGIPVGDTNGTINEWVSTPGDVWESQADAPVQRWWSVDYSPVLKQFAAVSTDGGGHQIMTSSDGKHWTLRTTPAYAATLVTVRWARNRWIATGIGPTTNYLMSPDGITWTKYTSMPAGNWYAVGTIKDTIIAVSGTGIIARSTDGYTWTQPTAPAAGNWSSVRCNQDTCVAVAALGGSGSGVMYSTDYGATWNAASPPSTQEWNWVSWTGKQFVAVADQSRTGKHVMTSPDGIAWTEHDAAADWYWATVSYGAGTTVALSADGYIMASKDHGNTWSMRTPPAAGQQLQQSVYADGIYVAVAANGTYRVITSGAIGDAIQPNLQPSMSVSAGLSITTPDDTATKSTARVFDEPTITLAVGSVVAGSNVTISKRTGTGTSTATGTVTSLASTESGTVAATSDPVPLVCQSPLTCAGRTGTGTATGTATGTGTFYATKDSAVSVGATNTGTGTLVAGTNVSFTTASGTATATTTAIASTATATVNITGVNTVTRTDTFTGSVSSNVIAKGTASGQGLQNSNITDNGTIVTVGLPLRVQGGTIYGPTSGDLELSSAQNQNYYAVSFTPLRLFKGTPPYDTAGNVEGFNFNIGALNDIDLGFFVDRTGATSWRARGSGSNANPVILRAKDGTLSIYADTAKADLSAFTPTLRATIGVNGITIPSLTGKGTGKVIYDTDGAGTLGEKTVCETGGSNCPSAATLGGLTGTLTTGTIPIATGAGSLGNSGLSESSGELVVSQSGGMRPTSGEQYLGTATHPWFSANSLNYIARDGSNNAKVSMDSTGIYGFTAATTLLDVSGNSYGHARLDWKIASDCAAGQYTYGANADGTPKCSTPSGTGTGMTCSGTCSSPNIVKFADATHVTNATAGSDYVAPNAAITASASYKAVTYDAKGLVTDGVTITPTNIGASHVSTDDASNSSGNVATDGAGTWTTVATVSIAPATSATVLAHGTASITAAYNSTECYMRIVYDSTSQFGTTVRGVANYTLFSPYALVARTTGMSGSHSIALQIKDSAVGGHTCTVMQYGGSIVVETINEN